ncbi:MAG: hypothetical protein A2Y17_00520 [Clostridiales bacterium GWF2_38_85]|nr:MAG: hypothetical protein A2Y17_00520 [Clostridiales bacterium GWF2_38_85]HBL83522.1 ABC transporter ATP-binding protein [Clostridiales bacterium]
MKKTKKSPYSVTLDALKLRFKGLCPDSEHEFRYTLTADNQPLVGYAAYYDKKLLFLDERSIDLRLVDIDSFSEIRCRQNYGCIALEIVTDKGDVELCRGDMSCMLGMQATAKKITIIKEGRTPNVEEDRIEKSCPVCGEPYREGSTICLNCVDKKQLIKRVLPFLKPFIFPLIIAFLLFFAISGVSLLIPQINRMLIDNYIQSSGNVVLGAFISVILLLAGVELAVTLMGIVRSITIAKVGNKISVNIKNSLYQKVQQLSLAGITKRSSGEIINRITNDSSMVQEFLTDTVPVLMQQLLNLVGIGIIVFIMNWKLALLIVSPMPIIFMMFYFLRDYTRRMYHKQWHASSNSNTILHDIFQGIRVVKVFGMEKYELKRFDKAIKTESEISAHNEVVWQKIMPPMNFLMGIGEYFILAYAGVRIISGDMTLGEMQAFLAYAGMLYGPLRWITFLPRRLSRQLTSIAKVFEIIDEEPEIKDAEKPLDVTLKGDIDFENAYFSYDGYEYVLKDVSLKIKKGDMIGIVGRSGVGKSTLINLIMRLYDLNEGNLVFDNIDVRKISQHSLRSQIGVVLQETFLFRGTIYNNIAYANPKATYDEVIRAAKLANAHQFIMKLPDGYNTLVGERGQTLSGGERQRIAIARAVLRNPSILILDEATASLDTETEKLIQDSIAALTKNRTTIAIAHRLSTLRNATRLIVLEKNKIEEEGTHDELMRKNGRYSKLVLAQRQMSKLTNKK